MNILYCGDGNIADGVMISVLSLTQAVKEALHIYILTASVENAGTRHPALGGDFAAFLDRKVKQWDPENTVRLYDITELFAAQPPTANMGTRFTPCCMLRLYADLVRELPDRILYLDNDVICRSDPGAFYHQDMQDAEIAGVLDYYGSWFFRNHPLKRDYLNSGVLLLNMEKIRQTGLFRQCRHRCRTREMFMPDQSALNKLCRSKRIADRKYNEQRRLRRDTVFQHFTTSFRFFPWFHTVSVKPWNLEGMHTVLKLYTYDSLLEQYKEMKEEITYAAQK